MSDIEGLLERDKNLYKVKLKEFEGPLDLLLHLVKTSEINIYDIPISIITSQYLDYLKLLVTLDLDNISEFVEMASTLVLIKSKTMLPIEVDYESDDIDLREDLISKLIEYQKYKIAAGLLDSRVDDDIEFRKQESDPMLFDIDEQTENWKPLSVIDLISAFAKMLNKKEDQYEMKLTRFQFSVEEKIEEINKLLLISDSFNYFEIIREDMPKLELICTFLALLELVKQQTIKVMQHIIFGDIHIVKKINLNTVDTQ